MLIVIIDFDNFFGTDVSQLSAPELELALTDIVNECENEFQVFHKIIIRLYGGWYHNHILTKQASIIEQLLSQIDIFPKIKGNIKINGSIELVSSLYEIPNYSWHYTYKEKNGVPRIRINFDEVDEFCKSNKNNCPKYILYKFTKHKDRECPVEGCNHIHKDVFKGIEQKMVDTMIACDVISTVKDENVKGVMILSDDQDHFPSYAIASTHANCANKIIVGVKNKDEQRFNLISDLLNPFNIKIITIS